MFGLAVADFTTVYSLFRVNYGIHIFDTSHWCELLETSHWCELLET